MEETIREQFEILKQGVIYLDSATTNLVPTRSIEKMKEFYQQTGSTVRRGIHSLASNAEDEFADAKTVLAKFIGAQDVELAWVPNQDYGINFLLSSIDFEPGDEVITSIFEHHSILAPLLRLKKTKNINIRFLSLEEEYSLATAVESLLNENTKLVALGHVTPLMGLYRDITTIANTVKMQRGDETLVLTDYSRSAGQKEINVKHAGIDFAVIDGSLGLLSPNGAAAVYIRRDIVPKIDTAIVGSTSVRYLIPSEYGLMRAIERFEPGQPNIAAMMALRESIQFLNEIGMGRIELHRVKLQKLLIELIEDVKRIELIDPLLDSKMGLPNRANIISLKLNQVSPHDIAMILDEEAKIAVRSGLLCSHPGIYALGLEGALQVSTHVFNTEEEIEVFINTLKGVMEII